MREKIGAALLGLLVVLITLELVFRAGAAVFTLQQTHLNEIALREGKECRILCVGESTTAMGGRFSYPSQLQDVLNSRRREITFPVINGGLIGASSSDIVAGLERSLDRYRPRIVVAMMGANDFDEVVPCDGESAVPPRDIGDSLKVWRFVKLVAYNRWRAKAPPPGGGDAPLPARSAQGLGEDLMRHGRYEEAKIQLQKAIELDPRSLAACISLAGCYERLGEYDEAARMFWRAFEFDPRNTDTFVKFVDFCARRARRGDARKLFSLVENLRSDVMFARISTYWARAGDHVKAKEYALKARDVAVRCYHPMTVRNYRRMKEMLDARGIGLVCVQYPMRPVGALRSLFPSQDGIVFVDSAPFFEAALKKSRYEDLFSDNCYGDFGHFTARGALILAETIADSLPPSWLE
jgi:hypothetical protein